MRRKDLELLRELKPGEEGTEELVAEYGEALVCVRLWYDPKNDVELKTAEIVDSRRKARSLRQSRETRLEQRSRRPRD